MNGAHRGFETIECDLIKRFGTREISLVAQNICEGSHVAAGIRMPWTEAALPRGDARPSKLFGLLKFSLLAQSANQVFHRGQGIRMIRAQSSLPGVQATTK